MIIRQHMPTIPWKTFRKNSMVTVKCNPNWSTKHHTNSDVAFTSLISFSFINVIYLRENKLTGWCPNRSWVRASSGQTKDLKTNWMCCFCTKHAVLRSKSKDWCAPTQSVRVERHVYPWTVVSLSYHYQHPTQRDCLWQSEHHQLIKR